MTQSALETVGKITSLEGQDPTDLKSIAAVQLQARDYNAVNRTLAGQEDFMSLFLRGKADFGLGNFQSANGLFNRCRQMIPKVEASLRPELERQCTVWTNKSQIELTSARSYGDINQGAYLNTSAPQNTASFQAATKASTAPSTTNASAQDASGTDGSCINLKYDWYQNVTHVFVGYKIKQGGEGLVNGGLSVNFTDSSMVLENS